MPNRVRDEAHRQIVPALATALALLGVALLWRDFGIAWDESPHAFFGEAVRRYFANGFDYTAVAAYPVENLRYYGPLFDLVNAVLAHLTGEDHWHWRHLLTGLFWAGTFWPVCSVAARIGGARAGAVAAVVLLAQPVFFGHGFYNFKDIPLACATAWVVLATVRAAEAPHLSWTRTLALGGALGLALALRPGALFLVPVAAAPFLIGSKSAPATPARFGTLPRLTSLATAAALAWVLMCIAWPYAHQDPVSHPIEGALYAARFDVTYSVLFAGQVLPSNALPRSYLPAWIALTTPPVHLLLALAGLAAAFGHLRALPRGGRAAVFSAAWAAVFPLIYTVAFRPNVYDGWRHFLFISPMLAVFAGVGAERAQRMVPDARAGTAVFTALAVAAAVPVASLVALHPYQAAYFNIFAGPRETIHERYETDYWVLSYREAAEWVNARQREAGRPLRVLLAANAFSAPAFTYFSGPGVRVEYDSGDYRSDPLPAGIDYYVATVRNGQWKNYAATPIVHRIAADGVLLTVIRGAFSRPRS